MIGRRPLAFWVVAAVFAALVLGWAVYVPYAPERIHRAVPASASFVSEHAQLAQRWDALSKNPFTLSLFGSLGIKAETLKDLGRDRESQRWLRKLASDRLVLAFVPHLGDTGQPGWVFASWLGGRSQRMRWQLTWFRVPGFTRAGTHGGRPIWRVHTRELDAGVSLSIAFVEGMVVGCLAPDPSAIRDVLETYDGHRPSVVALASSGALPAACREAEAGDRGWANLGAFRGAPAGLSPLAAYEFPDVRSNAMRGRLCLSGYPPLPAATPPAASRMDVPARLLGDIPIAVVAGPPAALDPWIEGRPLRPWARLFRELVERQDCGLVLAALLGQEYSGRFKGVRVPALVVGVPVRDPDAALRWAGQALERINAQLRWGLIPQAVEAGHLKVYAVEKTAPNKRAPRPLDERPAYAVVGNWLFVASDLAPLVKLVERYDRLGAVAAASAAPWLEPVCGTGDPVGGWIDLEGGRKTIRAAIATYSMKLQMENPRQSWRIRERMDEANAWIDALAPLSSCRLRAHSEGDVAQIEFEAGRSSEQ